jgi:outer membrane cobalamin receptor
LWGDLENTPGSGDIRRPVPKDYLTDVYQIGFQDNVTEDLNLHLYYQNKVQYPFLQPDTKNEVEYSNSWRRKVERKVYGVRGVFQFNGNLNIAGGVEQSQDLSTSLNRLTYSGGSDVFGHNNSNTAKIHNTAVFTQFDLTSGIANLTAGVRYDKPSIFNSTVVPRLGITKVVGPVHMKALYAKAFRAPVIENISLNEDIKPELTTTGEVEFGYQFNRDICWTLNLFSTKVSDAIVYSYDTVLSEENYNNYNYVKTLGMETEINLKKNIHDIKVNYSTYKVDSINAIPYETSKDSTALIGAPKHKVFIKDTLALTKDFSMTPSLTFLSRTNSYEWDGPTFSEARLASQFIANLFANYQNVFFQGLDFGAGINNILNTNIYYAQPYVKEGDYRAGAYPGQSREYILRVGYSKEF